MSLQADTSPGPGEILNMPPDSKGSPLLSSKQLFRAHSWVGLHFGLLLVIICISGVVATLTHEIDWLLNPAIRVTPQAERVSFSTLFKNVQAAYPDCHVAGIEHAENNYFASTAFIE